MASLLHEVANVADSGDDSQGYQSISCYLGNLHLSPIQRMWNTSKNSAPGFAENPEAKKKSVLLKNRPKKKHNYELNYLNQCRLEMRSDETAEEKIAKQALLEALFQT